MPLPNSPPLLSPQHSALPPATAQLVSSRPAASAVMSDSNVSVFDVTIGGTLPERSTLL